MRPRRRPRATPTTARSTSRSRSNTVVQDGKGLLQTYTVRRGRHPDRDRQPVRRHDDDRLVGEQADLEGRPPRRPEADHPAGQRPHRDGQGRRHARHAGRQLQGRRGRSRRGQRARRPDPDHRPDAHPPGRRRGPDPDAQAGRPPDEQGRRRCNCSGPSNYSGGAFTWPVVGGGNYISQYYHYGHYAIDIAADYGSTVRAAASGTVIFAGWKSNGGGYQVWISHGSGLYTTYSHMSADHGRRGRGRLGGDAGRPGRAVRPGDRPAPPLRGLGRPRLERRLPGQPAQVLLSGAPAAHAPAVRVAARPRVRPAACPWEDRARCSSTA